MKQADTQFLLDPAALHAAHPDATPAPGDTVVFDREESNHAVKALRLRPGDQLQATDGRGTRFQLELLDPHPDAMAARVLAVERVPEPTVKVVVALGMLKKRDRLEFAVEKLVELGAWGIVLMATDHSEKGIGRPDRMQAMVRRALKQSMRPYLPELKFARSLEEAVQQAKSRWDRIVLADETLAIGDTSSGASDESSEDGLQAKSREVSAAFPGRTLLLIGPEGGFSERERGLLQTCTPAPHAIGLGAYRLRAETAAIAGLIRLAAPSGV